MLETSKYLWYYQAYVDNIFVVGTIRLPNALPGFILLFIWPTIGTVVYILTLERHRTYRKIQKKQRKEKDMADQELIKELVDAEEDRIVKKKEGYGEKYKTLKTRTNSEIINCCMNELL